MKNSWTECINIALLQKPRLYFLLMEHDLSRLKDTIRKQ
jgi:hypothetical protein